VTVTEVTVTFTYPLELTPISAKIHGSMKAKIINQKKQLRDHFRKKLRHESVEFKIQKSRVISDLIHDFPAFRKAACVMFYVSFDGEVDTRSILETTFKEGKTVLLPVINERENKLFCSHLEDAHKMRPGKYGIMEPDKPNEAFPSSQIDLVFVPGLGFDRKNFRLGRGKGYYDRFLEQLGPHTLKVGLAYDFQLVDHLSVEEHDVPMDMVIHN